MESGQDLFVRRAALYTDEVVLHFSPSIDIYS